MLRTRQLAEFIKWGGGQRVSAFLIRIFTDSNLSNIYNEILYLYRVIYFNSCKRVGDI